MHGPFVDVGASRAGGSSPLQPSRGLESLAGRGPSSRRSSSSARTPEVPFFIRVNDQYRATFRWESGHAYEVSVEGYH